MGESFGISAYHQGMGKITDLLKTHFSTRKFSSKPILQAVLDDTLVAGELSP